MKPPEGVFPQTVEEGLILLSDDEDIDHPHSLDNDEEDDDNISKVKEMKPLRLPSGAVIKVEKDYWAKDEEQCQKESLKGRRKRPSRES